MAKSYMFDDSRNLVDSGINVTANKTVFSAIIDAIYPVGSIFLCLNATDPATIMPGTTWSRIAQDGRVLVGVKDGDPEFGSNKVGGSRQPAQHEHKVVYEGTKPASDLPSEKQPTDNYIYTDYVTEDTSGITPVGSAREMHYAITADQAGTYNQRGILKYLETVEKYKATGSQGPEYPGVNNPLKAENSGYNGAGKGYPPYMTCYMWRRVS